MRRRRSARIMNAMLDSIRQTADEQGFLCCGVAPAVESTGFSDLVRWIDAGYAAEMSYFANRLDAYRHPRGVLHGVKSLVALAYPYPAAPAEPVARGAGKIARYAWPGHDYHDVIHPKLKRLCQIVREHHPQADVRGVVDTAPLMEREIAQLAGLGWRGKNTLLLSRSLGSYFFLACLLTDVELPPDAPHTSDHCGTCTACLDACPTDAFPQPGVLDASRCISYLTIEHRGAVPRELRGQIGDWLFGCDVCQEVCPWNRKPSRTAASGGPAPRAGETNSGGETSHAGPPTQAGEPMTSIELTSLFSLSEEEFRARFRKTPLWRSRRRGILRNAAIVLGNQCEPASVPALIGALEDDEPLVRGTAAWALGQFGERGAEALDRRLQEEFDPEVRTEIERALADASQTTPSPSDR